MTPVKEEMERLFEEKEVKKQVSIMTYFRLQRENYACSGFLAEGTPLLVPVWACLYHVHRLQPVDVIVFTARPDTRWHCW